MAKVNRYRTHRVANDKDLRITFGVVVLWIHCCPTGGFTGLVFSDEIGLPDQIRSLMRRHQNSFVKLKVTCCRFDDLIVWIHLFHCCIGHMRDDVRIQLCKCFLIANRNGRDTRLGIKNNNFCRDLFFFKPPGHQACAVVG